MGGEERAAANLPRMGVRHDRRCLMEGNRGGDPECRKLLERAAVAWFSEE